jgi:hypothetical protein
VKGLFEQLPEKLKQSRASPLLTTKKRSASSTHGAHSSTDLPTSINASTVHRAATFPVPTKSLSFEANKQRATFDPSHYPISSTIDQNQRCNFQELLSPVDISGSGTPDSAHSMQNSLSLQQPLGDSNGVPDIGAMMFPSGDPFMYPNQPMIEYDSRQQKYEITGTAVKGSVIPMFLSNGAGPVGLYDSLEGQHFGPLPPYMSASQLDISQVEMCPISGIQDFRPLTGLTPGVGMDFDAIFAGKTEDWDMRIDQGYRQ